MGATGWLVVIIILAALIAVGYWLRTSGKKPEEDDEKPDDLGPEKKVASSERQPSAPVRKKSEEDRTSSKKESKGSKSRDKESDSSETSPAGGKDSFKPETAEDGGSADASPSAEASSSESGEEQAEGTSAERSAKPTAVVDEETRKERRKALRRGLKGTRGGFIAKLGNLLKGKKTIDPDLLEKLEEVLLTADVGVQFTEKLMKSIKDNLSGKELEDPDTVWAFLREQANAILSQDVPPFDIDNEKPFVIMVIGVNGVGKTTTIAKLASRYVRDGKKVVLAAGDTFRAAAVRQLEMWGQRVGAEVIKNDKPGADPSAVAFEAIEKAIEQNADVVIADTAGRLHTKTPLMDELKKVKRVMGKASEGSPHEVLLVLDSNTGQNAIQQVKEFDEALGVSGIVLTKLDGTAKGGVILGICEEHEIPVRFIGIGERDDDLRTFDADDFVAVMFERPDESGESAA